MKEWSLKTDTLENSEQRNVGLSGVSLFYIFTKPHKFSLFWLPNRIPSRLAGESFESLKFQFTFGFIKLPI
jgi:hypothetical protein